MRSILAPRLFTVLLISTFFLSTPAPVLHLFSPPVWELYVPPWSTSGLPMQITRVTPYAIALFLAFFLVFSEGITHKKIRAMGAIATGIAISIWLMPRMPDMGMSLPIIGILYALLAILFGNLNDNKHSVRAQGILVLIFLIALSTQLLWAKDITKGLQESLQSWNSMQAEENYYSSVEKEIEACIAEGPAEKLRCLSILADRERQTGGNIHNICLRLESVDQQNQCLESN